MASLRNYELSINGQVYIKRMTTPASQLRCVFDVIASPGDAFATADIRLYNLVTSSSPRNATGVTTVGLQPKQGDAVQLAAGYTVFDSTVDPQEGVVVSNIKDEIGIIFTGTVTNVFRERDGANIVTRLLCRSGDGVNDTGTANSSYSPGATLYDVLTDLARSWGKRLVVDKERTQTVIMTSGYMTDGDITREINTLAKAYGFMWTNYNGQLSVTFPLDARGTAKHIISQSTGMIGIPELSGGTDGVFVDVSNRLNPFMNINDRIEVSAQFQTFNTGNAFVTSVEAHASGLYNILALRFRGDNWGNIWRVDINALRAGSGAETTLDSGAKLIWGAKVSQPFRVKVREVAKRQGVEANWLMSVMAFETGNSFLPYVKNPVSGATGLIQFTRPTATGLGTSTTQLSRMTAVEQLDWVEKYYDQYKGQIKNLGDAYMAVFAPVGIGKPDSTVLYSSPSAAYNQNAGLDTARKGYITRGDCIVRVNKAFKQGQQYAAG